ncbi:MAG: carboxymethylenebutenolidase [Blastocatellia bacterium]|jgi:carboxymethylenebutenolidase|nr:carboxymethylenebutenolidase [Blastocatellia bacterium]
MKAADRLRVLTTIGIAVLALFTIANRASGQGMDHQHMNHTMPVASSDPETQDWAKARLAKSSRHQEWVKVKNGDREVNAFVVYPEVSKKATAVIVIHEIFGMSDWVQSLTDQLAEAGYIAIAPDLLSGMGLNGGGTDAIRAADSNGVGKAIQALPPDQITGDLNAIAAYVTKLPAANGKLAVGGFCWGGTQTFLYATNNPKLKAAFVFYGSAPMKAQEMDLEALARIKTPVYGFYAGNDVRINATLPKTIAAMNELKKKYDPLTYEGAGHGFMRAGDAPPPTAPVSKGDQAADEKAAADYQKALVAYQGNKKARDEAWIRWKKLLGSL